MNKCAEAIVRVTCIAFTALLFIVMSCDNNEPKLYKISGAITGDSDKVIEPLSNAHVLLYNATPEDSSVVSLHALYPNIGALQSKVLSFDHRLATPKQKTLSDAEGRFELSGVEAGDYYVVFFCDNWGFRYLPLTVSDSNVSNVNVSLHQVIELPPLISSDYILLDDRVYHVSSNLILLENVNLVCNGNSTIIMNPGTEANLYGDLLVDASSSLRILSSDKLYSTAITPEQIENFNHIGLYHISGRELKNVVMSDAIYGLRVIDSNNVSLSNLSIQSRYLALSLSNIDNASIVNCTVSNSRESSLAAVYCENSNNIAIEKSHFYKNMKGISISNSGSVEIRNCYFNSNSSIDISFGEYSTGTVEHCNFPNSNLAISNYKGQIQAHWNDISANIGIYSYQLLASFSANNNNFNCTEYAIKSRSIFYNSDIVVMDATQNYWFTTSIGEIEELIYDRNDESTSDVNYSILKSVVDFQPFRYQRVNAGIADFESI